MRLPAIITTDLHLTSDPNDEYRWGLFPWLIEQGKKGRVRSVAILGDLTDAKDYHSSVLVNRVVDNIKKLRDAIGQVLILVGNHDYLKDGHPYFSFLNALDGVKFIHEPFSDLEEELPVLWLPHSKNPAKEWEVFKSLDWYSHIFMHQTFNGSVASNGQKMEGDGVDRVSWMNKDLVPEVWSGDIHVPQKKGLVEYVGSPYHVHFGDSFSPRAILLERGGKRKDLVFPTIQRATLKLNSLDDLFSLEVSPGDQVKLKMVMDESEQQDWPRWRERAKQWAAKEQVQLCGLALEVKKSRRRLEKHEDSSARPEDILFKFVSDEDLGPDAYETGMEILEK